jgi:hypothetical protein
MMPHKAYSKRSGHQRIRVMLIAQLQAMGGVGVCGICGQPMSINQPIDLHHSDPMAKLRGEPGDVLAHRSCNRRNGRPPKFTMVHCPTCKCQPTGPAPMRSTPSRQWW